MEPSESIPVGKQLARILARYETEMDMTLPDVVVLVSALAEESGNQALADAVKLYREEERFDRTNLGMRGDMDAVENAFLKSVSAIATEPEQATASGEYEEWNYSMVNDAIANARPYPASLIEKIIGAREHELPVLERAGYRLEGDSYFPPEYCR